MTGTGSALGYARAHETATENADLVRLIRHRATRFDFQPGLSSRLLDRRYADPPTSLCSQRCQFVHKTDRSPSPAEPYDLPSWKSSPIHVRDRETLARDYPNWMTCLCRSLVGRRRGCRARTPQGAPILVSTACPRGPRRPAASPNYRCAATICKVPLDIAWRVAAAASVSDGGAFSGQRRD